MESELIVNSIPVPPNILAPLFRLHCVRVVGGTTTLLHLLTVSAYQENKVRSKLKLIQYFAPEESLSLFVQKKR